MTRIIAGAARGHRLRVPPRGTRPTADRVREAIFNSVAHELGGLSGLSVLDLFAGSGALGLEAASRGASRVVLVESERTAASVVRENAATVSRALAATGGPGSGAPVALEVVAAAVSTFLGGVPRPFDLVLADPPYSLGAQELQTLLSRLPDGWLSPAALVVVERASRSQPLLWPAPLAALQNKRYSETTIWYGQLAQAQ